MMQTQVQSPPSPSRGSMIPVRVRRNSGLSTPPHSRAATPAPEGSSSPEPGSSPSRFKQSNVRSTGLASPNASPKREPLLIRVPSRTQLQELRSGRRPSLTGGKGSQAEQDRDNALARIRQRFESQSASSFGLRAATKFRAQNVPIARKAIKRPPHLYSTLSDASIALMADSSNMKTMAYSIMLNAGYLSPPSVIDDIYNWDKYYFVWLGVKDTFDIMPNQTRPECYKHLKDFTKSSQLPPHVRGILRAAFCRFMIRLIKGIYDCLDDTNVGEIQQKRDLRKPMFAFVDTRGLDDAEEKNNILEQAISIVKGLEEEGISRELIFISIPATEAGLEIARILKEKHSIQTNLVFVSGLQHAAACAGMTAITMPVDTIVGKHEAKRGLDFTKLTPHPGQQEVNAAALYIQKNSPETMVIANDLENLDDIKYLPSVDAFCIADWQVEKAKWHRLRFEPSPGQESIETRQAMIAPFPFVLSGSKFLEQMSPEVRRETLSVLDIGMRNWNQAVQRIESMLVNEIMYTLDLDAGFRTTIRSYDEIRQNPKLHWLVQTRNLFDLDLDLSVAFPVSATSSCFDDMPVPPTPYLLDMDEFDTIGSDSGSDGECAMELE